MAGSRRRLVVLFEPGEKFSLAIVTARGPNAADVALGMSMFCGDVPFNQVQARCRLYNMADLTGFQRKCSILKFLLHIALSKETTVDVSVNRVFAMCDGAGSDLQVSSLPRTAAV